MSKKSPLQQVKEQFGTKKALADQLIPVIDRLNPNESDADFARRIQAASNKQLLRLHAVEQTVKERFGSRDALIDAIVQAKFGKANADYRQSLTKYTKVRLLDLHRQIAG